MYFYYTFISILMYLSTYLLRLIIWNWLMQLLRWRSPTIFHVQNRDSGESVIQFQSECEVLRIRRPEGISSSPSAEDHCPSLKKSDGKSKFPLILLFFILRPPTLWTRPSLIRRKICFTQSTNSNINCIRRHPHRYNQDT